MAPELDLQGLAGSEKAAMLMMAIGEEGAAQLLAMMEESEIRALSHHMANLGPAKTEVVEALLADFTRQLTGNGSVVGDCDSTERLLSRVLDRRRVDDIMNEIRGPDGRSLWSQLAGVEAQPLADYLQSEYPQTAAVVLSRLDPAQAAAVLSALTQDYAAEVVARMLKMDAVQEEVLREVEQSLRDDFMANLPQRAERDPHQMMATIFNHMDQTAEGRFLEGLDDRDRAAAERIKALMFTFEDLAKLSASAAQTLLSEADNDPLCLALKGASERLRSFFLSNMSERAGKMLREDMEALGPVRLREAEDAQSEIVELAKALAAKGDIAIADERGGDKLVY